MTERSFIIQNKLGMHARAASLFVKTAEKFSCSVEMEKDGIKINAKSIMGILMLAAPLGSEIKVTTRGSDEAECMEALAEVINNKFGEE